MRIKSLINAIFISAMGIIPLFSESIWVKYGNQVFSSSGDAASIALSESNIAQLSGPLAVILNPSQLYFVKQRSISISHQERFSGVVNYDIIGFHLKGTYKQAIVLIREGVQHIPNTTKALLYNSGSLDDKNERILTSKVSFFNQVQWAGIMGMATSRGDWILGGSAKTIFHQLDHHHGYGIGFDLGLSRSWTTSNQFAFVFRDVTTSWVIWESGTVERIAPEILFGDLQKIRVPLFHMQINMMATTVVNTGGKALSDDFSIGQWGGSFLFGLDVDYKDQFHLRLGRNPISKYSFGIGLGFPFGTIDYAYVPSPSGTVLGNSHYLTLNIKFHFISSLKDRLHE